MSAETVFIAAKFETRGEIKLVREDLRAMGYTVVCRWLDESGDGYPGDEYWQSRSDIDWDDTAEAGIFVLDTRTVSNTGGREVELGRALACGKEVFLVGPRRNVHHFRVRTIFEDWDKALDYFRGRKKREDEQALLSALLRVMVEVPF